MFGGAMKKESKSTKDTGHSFADYFKRALNPLLVLLLLSEQPMYVYEMMRDAVMADILFLCSIL